MSDSGAIVYRFQADTSALKSALADVKSQFNVIGQTGKAMGDSLAAGMATVNSGLKTVENAAAKVTLGLSALAVAASAYLVGIGTAATNFGDSVRTAAGAFDQTTQTASEIKAVAERSGSSLDNVGKAFLDLQKKAASGDEAVTHALTAIGVKASDVAGISQRELAGRMADAFSTLKDSSNKAQAGVILFGADVAGKLVPQLDRGRDSVNDMMNAASRAGAVIGPDLAAKLAGTSSLFQGLKDKLAELGETITGRLLQSFASFKGAIDGLILAFTDLIGNVTSLIEWYYDLNGAGEKTGASFGMLTKAANWFAEAMIKTIIAAEEMALQVAKWVDECGLSFMGLVKVVEAAGQDIVNIGAVYAKSFVDEWKVNLGGLIEQFGHLGLAAGRAMKLDFTGAKAALNDYADANKRLAEEYQKAVNPDYMKNTHQAWNDMQIDANKYTKEIAAASAALEKQKKTQLDLVAAGGLSKTPIGTRTAGDPSVPKKVADPKEVTESKDAIERYLDTLNKAKDTAKAEYDTWASTNVERAKAVGLAQLKADADKDGLTITEQQRQKVIDLTTATQMLKDKTEQLKSTAQGLSDAFASSLDDLIVKGGKANEVMQQLLQTLASAVLKGVLTGDGMFGQLGGAAGSGGVLGGLFKGLLSGFRADGGPVMGGSAYVVGERGPELFQPNGGGTIVPNGAGSSSGTVNHTINISLAGANGDASIRQMVTAGVQAGLGQFSTLVLPGRVNEIALRGA